MFVALIVDLTFDHVEQKGRIKIKIHHMIDFNAYRIRIINPEKKKKKTSQQERGEDTKGFQNPV